MVSMSHLSSFTSAMLYYDNICPAEPWQQTLGIYNLVDKWKIASQTHHSRHIGRVWYYLITEVDAQDGSIQEASPAPSKALLIFLFLSVSNVCCSTGCHYTEIPGPLSQPTESVTLFSIFLHSLHLIFPPLKSLTAEKPYLLSQENADLWTYGHNYMLG